MFDFSSLYRAMDGALAPWAEQLPAQLAHVLSSTANGHYDQWCRVLSQFPIVHPSSVDLSAATVRVGTSDDCDAATRAEIDRLLRALIPWRKGPFEVFGTHIDTEWRSDWKWSRLQSHVSSLHGRRVLDVGCGSGYHCWRMLGEGARQVIGIDPSLLFFFQFHAINHFVRREDIHHLPLPLEAVPARLQAFDTVFSMGVLYHRRSPLDHIAALFDCLAPGGELVLETLVVEGDATTLLMPEDRYAMMRNVWFIPSCSMLERWVQRCGFRDVRTVDVCRTTTQEQRATEWMRFQSLADFLDPEDPGCTIEGYPAPIRAVVVARKP